MDHNWIIAGLTLCITCKEFYFIHQKYAGACLGHKNNRGGKNTLTELNEGQNKLKMCRSRREQE